MMSCNTGPIWAFNKPLLLSTLLLISAIGGRNAVEAPSLARGVVKAMGIARLLGDEIVNEKECCRRERQLTKWAIATVPS